jgi:hypothetical protein
MPYGCYFRPLQSSAIVSRDLAAPRTQKPQNAKNAKTPKRQERQNAKNAKTPRTPKRQERRNANHND